MRLNIRNPFASIKKRWEETEKATRLAQVENSVQVREFDGKLYLCYDDVPLIEESMLQGNICTMVAESRQVVKKYKGLI